MEFLFEAAWKAMVTFLVVGFFTAVCYCCGLNESQRKKVKKREFVDLFVAVVVLVGAVISLVTTVVQVKYVILVYLSSLAVFVSLVNLTKKFLDLKDKLMKKEEE